MTERNLTDSDHLTREEAADVLRVSLSTIDRYLGDGTLPKRKIGKRIVRISRADIDALLSTPSSSGSPQGDEGVSVVGQVSA